MLWTVKRLTNCLLNTASLLIPQSHKRRVTILQYFLFCLSPKGKGRRTKILTGAKPNRSSSVSTLSGERGWKQDVTKGSKQTMGTCHFTSVSMETCKGFRTKLAKLLITVMALTNEMETMGHKCWIRSDQSCVFRH